MSITPVEGGEILHRLDQPAEVINPFADCSCPKCASRDWKLASMVYSEGLSVTSSNTRGKARGAGVGLSRGGVGVAVGGARINSSTRGVTQTQMSAAAAPPVMKQTAQGVLALFFFLFAYLALSDMMDPKVEFGLTVWHLTLAVLFGYLTYIVHTKRQEKHEAASRQYQNLKMCQRCGTFF